MSGSFDRSNFENGIGMAFCLHGPDDPKFLHKLLAMGLPTPPIDWAARSYKRKLIRELIDLGADLNAVGAFGFTPVESTDFACACFWLMPERECQHVSLGQAGTKHYTDLLATEIKHVQLPSPYSVSKVVDHAFWGA